MNKTNIEWVLNPDGSQGYTWNPITGCLNHDNGLCKGGGFPCYAFKLANGRLKQRYISYHGDSTPLIANYNELPLDKAEQVETDPFYPRFWEGRMKEMMDRYTQLQCCTTYPPKRGVFVCDMGDLFGIGVPKPWTNQVLDAIRWNGYDRFYILTKQAARLPEFSPFPDNAWVGVTATKWLSFSNALGYLMAIKAKVKYLSFEPLLERIQLDMLQKVLFPSVIDWLIIGACTGTKKDMEELCRRYPDLTLMPCGKKWTAQPKIEWVREIVEAADKAGVKVFLKDNLNPLFAGNDCAGFNQYKDQLFTIVDNFPTRYHLRQELPA